jgi:hypothetical protein
MKGTPTKEELTKICPLQKPAQAFPEKKGEHIISRLEPGVPPELVDLLERLLCYAP